MNLIITWFVASCIWLNLFLNRDKLKDISRVTTSVIFALCLTAEFLSIIHYIKS